MLILASASPRRKEILSFFKIPFNVLPSNVDESVFPFSGNPKAYVQELAEAKAKSVAKEEPGIPVLSADTIVSFENKLFLKPKDRNHAFETLKFLSGKTHQVLTGVTVAQDNLISSHVEVSNVTFHPFTDKEIENYIASIHVFDKAGSYAIQGIGSLIVKKIEGCFYNVMGLPISSVARLLEQFGFSVWDHLKNSPS